MNKILSYLAIVVLSVAGFSTAAKETSTTPQKTLANVEAKTTAMATVVEKTEEIKVSTLEKIEKQLNELDAQKNERTKIEIERDRKSIEFWFAALAILTAVGALFPFLLGRKEKELLKLELAGVKNDRIDVQRIKDDVQKDKVQLQGELKNAKDMVASISHQHSSAEKSATSMSNLVAEFSSNNKPTMAEKLEVSKQAESIAKDPNASQIDKLRARAVEASQHEQPTREQAEIAFDLWKAIAVENPQDVKAMFNAAFWAGTKAELSEAVNKIHWLHQAQKLNEQVLKINPEVHVAAFNWGLDLSKEAAEVAKTDLKTAQKLWRQAGERYELALKINPEDHESAFNWGATLLKQAIVLEKTDRKAAQTLWQQAGEKYKLALKIKPSEDYQIAYDLWKEKYSENDKT